MNLDSRLFLVLVVSAVIAGSLALYGVTDAGDDSGDKFDEDFRLVETHNGSYEISNPYLTDQGLAYEYSTYRDHIFFGAGELHSLDDEYFVRNSDGGHLAAVGGELAFVAGREDEFVVLDGERATESYEDILDIASVGGNLAFLAESNGTVRLVSGGEELGNWSGTEAPEDLIGYRGKIIYGSSEGYYWLNGSVIAEGWIDEFRKINGKLAWVKETGEYGGKVTLTYGNQKFGEYSSNFLNQLMPYKDGIAYQVSDQWYVSGQKVNQSPDLDSTALTKAYRDYVSPIEMNSSRPEVSDALTEKGEYVLEPDEVVRINGTPAYITNREHTGIRYGEERWKGEDLLETDRGPVYVRDIGDREVLYRKNKSIGDEIGIEYDRVLQASTLDGKLLLKLWTGNSTAIYFNGTVEKEFRPFRVERAGEKLPDDRISGLKSKNGHYLYTAVTEKTEQDLTYEAYIDGESRGEFSSSLELLTYRGRPLLKVVRQNSTEILGDENLSAEIEGEIVEARNVGKDLLVQYRGGEDLVLWLDGERIANTSSEISRYDVVKTGDRLCYVVDKGSSEVVYCGEEKIQEADYIWDIADTERGFSFLYSSLEGDRLVMPDRSITFNESVVSLSAVGNEILFKPSNNTFFYGGTYYSTGNSTGEDLMEASGRLMPVLKRNSKTEVHLERVEG